MDLAAVMTVVVMTVMVTILRVGGRDRSGENEEGNGRENEVA